MTLPALLRKAANDAGFDLADGSDGEWQRVGVSGTKHELWILPTGVGAVFAVANRPLLREFSATTWTEVPLPRGAVGAFRCRSAAELYDTLRRARMLLDQLPPAPQQRFADRLAAVGGTETEALVRQRVGQELFREMLMEYWGGCCAVTGLDVPELLRASHAKPWKDSTDDQRLNVYNGLLLAVHFDALFDRGLMTFDDDGGPLFSPCLPAEAKRLLIGSMDPDRRVRLMDAHLAYFAHHRQHVFRSGIRAPDTANWGA